MGWSQLFELSVAAGGPVDLRAAAAASGLTPRAVRDRARREGWWWPYRHVLAVPGTARDGRARALAAVLHGQGGVAEPGAHAAAATRSTALALYGVQRSFPTSAEVSLAADRSLLMPPGLTVVRSRLLEPDEISTIRGVPVLRGGPLLRDLAAVRDRNALRATIIDLAQRGYVEVEGLPTFLRQQPPFPGKAVLRQAVADLVGAGRTDSPMEWIFRERLLVEDIPLDPGQVAVPGTRGMHLDLGIAEVRFGIDLQSVGFHTLRQHLDRDVARANALAALEEWRVLYATWSVLEQGWSDFVDQVRGAVAVQSRRHLGLPWPPAPAR